MTASPTERRRGMLLALGLIVAAAAVKLGYTPGIGASSLDGDYYFQIARHIAEGDGFLTSVSLYHQGLRFLPHPATVYPLWPILLGESARLLGLERAARIVPEVLYLLDLALIYLLCARLSRRLRMRPIFRSRLFVLDAGHAVLLLLATNLLFFRFTSLPYTEALGFALALGSLIALDNALGGDENTDSSPLLLWSAVAGGLAGAAYLTRFQMLPLVLATGGTLALGTRSRRGLAAASLALAMGMLAVVLEAVYLFASVARVRLAMLLDFTAYRETQQIAPFRFLVHSPSAWAFLKDRATGLLVAFNPWDEDSYVASFGAVAFLVLLAVLASPFPRSWLANWLGKAPKGGTLLLGVALAGLGLLAPVHAAHATFFKPWLFGWRHGLPLILLILASLIVLLAHPLRLFRVLGLCAVAISLVTNAMALANEISSPPRGGPSPAETEPVAWIEAQKPRPTILTTKAQQLSLWTRAGIHWTYCADDPAQTSRLLTNLPVDYLLLYPDEDRCRFVSSLSDQLDQVARFGQDGRGIRVFRWQS